MASDPEIQAKSYDLFFSFFSGYSYGLGKG